MRAALFGRLAADDQAMGALAETAIYCQWFHDSEFLSHLHYARWATGEIDIVRLDAATQKPNWCVEVKWSDRPANDSKQLRNVIAFAKEHQLPGNPLDDSAGMVTTKTIQTWKTVDGIRIEFVPTSLYAYVLGRNLLQKLAGTRRVL